MNKINKSKILQGIKNAALPLDLGSVRQQPLTTSHYSTLEMATFPHC